MHKEEDIVYLDVAFLLVGLVIGRRDLKGVPPLTLQVDREVAVGIGRAYARTVDEDLRTLNRGLGLRVTDLDRQEIVPEEPVLDDLAAGLHLHGL